MRCALTGAPGAPVRLRAQGSYGVAAEVGEVLAGAGSGPAGAVGGAPVLAQGAGQVDLVDVDDGRARQYVGPEVDFALGDGAVDHGAWFRRDVYYHVLSPFGGDEAPHYGPPAGPGGPWRLFGPD